MEPGNFRKIVSLSDANTNKDTQILVTKLAATCNVPYETLGFNHHKDEMELIYQQEKTQHLARKGTNIGKLVQGMVLPNVGDKNVINTPNIAHPKNDGHGLG